MPACRPKPGRFSWIRASSGCQRPPTLPSRAALRAGDDAPLHWSLADVLRCSALPYFASIGARLTPRTPAKSAAHLRTRPTESSRLSVPLPSTGRTENTPRAAASGLTEIAGKYAQIAGQRAQIAGKRAEIGEKRAQIAGKHAQIAGKHAEIAGKHAEIAGKHAETAEKRAGRCGNQSGMAEQLNEDRRARGPQRNKRG